LARAEILLEPALKARLETRAKAEERSFGELVRELLSAAIEAREAGPGGVAKSRADRLVELMEEGLRQQCDLATFVGAVGRVVIGNQQLLLYWATREDGLRIAEDDLFAEMQASGAEGWQQVMDELGRGERTPPGGDPEE
jgi:hypothetical protein